jgi:hypothetical protein
VKVCTGTVDFFGAEQHVSKIKKIRNKKPRSGSLHLKANFLMDRRLPMKFIRFCTFFLFITACCTFYANENKYVFVGQNGNDGLAKTVFVLELMGADLEQYVQINENGEVYLKVDKIVAIPKETFSHFASFCNSTMLTNASQNMMETGGADEEYVCCSNCRFYYYARPGHRDCPRCHTLTNTNPKK